MSGDVLTWELLLALSGCRPLMLLDTLKCAGQRTTWSEMLIMSRLRNPDPVRTETDHY